MAKVWHVAPLSFLVCPSSILMSGTLGQVEVMTQNQKLKRFFSPVFYSPIFLPLIDWGPDLGLPWNGNRSLWKEKLTLAWTIFSQTTLLESETWQKTLEDLWRLCRVRSETYHVQKKVFFRRSARCWKSTWTILPSQIGSTNWGSSSISLLKFVIFSEVWRLNWSCDDNF